MTHVYIVQHVHRQDSDREDVKLIGVYSSENQARRAIERLKAVTGFRDAPNSFSVDQYEVDKDNWTEGFITV